MDKKAIVFLISVLFIGCSSSKEVSPDVQSDSQAYLHRVKFRGETLGLIALWYTGSAGNWKEIASTNPALNPNSINIGDEIVIPQSMISKSDSLPESFIKNRKVKRKKTLKKRAGKKEIVKEVPEANKEILPVEADSVAPLITNEVIVSKEEVVKEVQSKSQIITSSSQTPNLDSIQDTEKVLRDNAQELEAEPLPEKEVSVPSQAVLDQIFSIEETAPVDNSGPVVIEEKQNEDEELFDELLAQ